MMDQRSCKASHPRLVTAVVGALLAAAALLTVFSLPRTPAMSRLEGLLGRPRQEGSPHDAAAQPQARHSSNVFDILKEQAPNSWPANDIRLMLRELDAADSTQPALPLPSSPRPSGSPPLIPAPVFLPMPPTEPEPAVMVADLTLEGMSADSLTGSGEQHLIDALAAILHTPASNVHVAAAAECGKATARAALPEAAQLVAVQASSLDTAASAGSALQNACPQPTICIIDHYVCGGLILSRHAFRAVTGSGCTHDEEQGLWVCGDLVLEAETFLELQDTSCDASCSMQSDEVTLGCPAPQQPPASPSPPPEQPKCAPPSDSPCVSEEYVCPQGVSLSVLAYQALQNGACRWFGVQGVWVCGDSVLTEAMYAAVHAGSCTFTCQLAAQPGCPKADPPTAPAPSVSNPAAPASLPASSDPPAPSPTGTPTAAPLPTSQCPRPASGCQQEEVLCSNGIHLAFAEYQQLLAGQCTASGEQELWFCGDMVLEQAAYKELLASTCVYQCMQSPSLSCASPLPACPTAPCAEGMRADEYICSVGAYPGPRPQLHVPAAAYLAAQKGDCVPSSPAKEDYSCAGFMLNAQNYDQVLQGPCTQHSPCVRVPTLPCPPQPQPNWPEGSGSGPDSPAAPAPAPITGIPFPIFTFPAVPAATSASLPASPPASATPAAIPPAYGSPPAATPMPSARPPPPAYTPLPAATPAPYQAPVPSNTPVPQAFTPLPTPSPTASPAATPLPASYSPSPAVLLPPAYAPTSMQTPGSFPAAEPAAAPVTAPGPSAVPQSPLVGVSPSSSIAPAPALPSTPTSTALPTDLGSVTIPAPPRRPRAPAPAPQPVHIPVTLSPATPPQLLPTGTPKPATSPAGYSPVVSTPAPYIAPVPQPAAYGPVAAPQPAMSSPAAAPPSPTVTPVPSPPAYSPVGAPAPQPAYSPAMATPSSPRLATPAPAVAPAAAPLPVTYSPAATSTPAAAAPTLAPYAMPYTASPRAAAPAPAPTPAATPRAMPPLPIAPAMAPSPVPLVGIPPAPAPAPTAYVALAPDAVSAPRPSLAPAPGASAPSAAPVYRPMAPSPAGLPAVAPSPAPTKAPTAPAYSPAQQPAVAPMPAPTQVPAVPAYNPATLPNYSPAQQPAVAPMTAPAQAPRVQAYSPALRLSPAQQPTAAPTPASTKAPSVPAYTLAGAPVYSPAQQPAVAPMPTPTSAPLLPAYSPAPYAMPPLATPAATPRPTPYAGYHAMPPVAAPYAAPPRRQSPPAPPLFGIPPLPVPAQAPAGSSPNAAAPAPQPPPCPVSNCTVDEYTCAGGLRIPAPMYRAVTAGNCTHKAAQGMWVCADIVMEEAFYALAKSASCKHVCDATTPPCAASKPPAAAPASTLAAAAASPMNGPARRSLLAGGNGPACSSDHGCLTVTILVGAKNASQGASFGDSLAAASRAGVLGGQLQTRGLPELCGAHMQHTGVIDNEAALLRTGLPAPTHRTLLATPDQLALPAADGTLGAGQLQPIPGSSQFVWMGSEWGACSTACGGGEQTRHVGCYHPSNGTRAQDIFCQGSSPAESRPCNQAPCAASWYLARVSSCADPSDQPMSAPLCMDVQGRLLSAEVCGSALHQPIGRPCTVEELQMQALAVPSTTQPRSAEATSYTWYIGAWEACSAECGGGEASRAVHCVTPIGDIVEDGRCPSAKPAAAQACNVLPCNLCAASTCSEHGTCSDNACHCQPGWSGRECEIPASCESGIVDGLGLCCAAGVVSAAGSCCASPSAVLDAQGDCCNAGVVDACGVCGGAAQFADVQGACCATALDAAGVCCASGRLDGCGMCNGKGASCSTRGTVNLQIANLAAGDTSAAHLNATLTGLLGAALGSSVVITDMQLPPEWTAALPSEQEPVQMQTRRLRGHALASLIRGASQLLRLSSAGAAAPAEPAEEPTLRLRFAAAPLAGLHLASVVAAIGEVNGTLLSLDSRAQISSAQLVQAEQQGTCGDGICQAGERDASHTALACPEDCPHAFVSCPAPAAEGLHASKPCNGQGRCFTSVGACDCFEGYTGTACDLCAAGYRPGLELGTCIRDASIVLPPTQNSPEKGASPKPSTAPGLTKALSAFQAFADAHVGDVRAKVPGGKVRSHLMEATYSFVAGIEFHPHLLAAVLVLTAAFIVAVHKIAAARS